RFESSFGATRPGQGCICQPHPAPANPDCTACRESEFPVTAADTKRRCRCSALLKERDALRARVAELEAALGELVGSLKWWNEDTYDREAPDWRDYEEHLPKEADHG